jgi:hypothetical protein
MLAASPRRTSTSSPNIVHPPTLAPSCTFLSLKPSLFTRFANTLLHRQNLHSLYSTRFHFDPTKSPNKSTAMFSKTFFAVAFAAVASVASAASSPPGCLLGAVNTYDTPSDIKAVCNAKDITTQVSKKCGDKAEDALAALADICNDAGVKVCTSTPSRPSIV